MAPRFYRAAVSVALWSLLTFACMAADNNELVAVSDGRRIMGAAWKIKVFAREPAAGDAAIAAAFAEVARLDMVFSDYAPDSELFKLSIAAPTPEPVVVSDDLWKMLVAAEELRKASDGAFDITVGPLTALWRQARRTGKLPRVDKLTAARAAVGTDALVLDAGNRTVRLTRPGMRLDAGGIGMGYAADRAMEILKARGIASAMIDASGDILVSEPPPGSDGWRIMIAPLRPGDEGETVVLSNASVTTSGDAFQSVEIEGIRYSHIVDPRTGMGVRGPAAVTVIAAEATLADAIATAASVLGPADGEEFMHRYEGVSARFMWREGNDVRTLVTPGWPRSNATTRADAP